MSYKPIKIEQETIEAAVAVRVKEILNSIEKVSSLYVEPGDVILVQMSPEAEDRTIAHIQQIISKVFTENRGMLLSDDMEVKVIRKGEGGEAYDLSEVEALRKSVERLTARLESIESLISQK